MRFSRLLAPAAFAAVAFSTQAFALDITGAGATFPYPIYAKWADAYKKQTGSGMNYQSIGSGGGIKQITAKTVDFGASDMPLKAEDLEKNGLVQFPAIMGGVVPVVKLEGVQPGQLKFTGQLQNKAGKFVQPDDASFKAAAAGADWKSVPGMGVVLTDQGGDRSWPITGASFILVHAKQDKPEAGREVLKFFDWAFKNGQKM